MQSALTQLQSADFRAAALNFFAALGYSSSATFDLPALSFPEFVEALSEHEIHAERALSEEWNAVHLLFQFSGADLGSGSLSLPTSAKRELFDAFVFIALELRGDSYNRTDLAGIARELNKPFQSPVIVLFKHGATVTLASVARRENKVVSGAHVLEKVTLLKDIRLEQTHRAHLDILGELAGAKLGAANWTEFLKRWNATLDLSLLNKKFYRELSNWFFAAKEHVRLPDKSDNAVERGLIRLITRLIFTWFIKERDLVPDALLVPHAEHQPPAIARLLKDAKPESGTYYRAVLQNLFFATLNSEMGDERRFRAEKGGVHGQKGDYGLSCFFRYQSEFRDPSAWLKLTQNVPFLNGGLFECLDPEDKDGARIDGFSDDPKRQAHIPNFLFWGESFTADLSLAYDDKKQKTALVKPLLELLHAYKFTIDENTPLEEDVALDPELLGKVFENLLASYNPETRTTARKQTGSFYTPREIVGYMTEEALRAYLEPFVGDMETAGLSENPLPNPPPHAGEGTDPIALPGNGSEGDMTGSLSRVRGRVREGESGRSLAPDSPINAPSPLSLLLSDTDARPALELGFSPAQIEVLVEALQRVTILDPACGSGAFPMGALSKMVALLKKLDPDNNLWLAAQLKSVAGKLQLESASPDARESARLETEAIFADNNRDYTRKLFLIERCLFGVDIQPIALQIAKLRFFIALIIDQRIDRARPNFGVRALPNLETKFVAANTLLAPQDELKMTWPELQTLLDDLDHVRRAHVSPKDRAEKKRLEKRDVALVAAIEAEVVAQNWDKSYAAAFTTWNPYDQNAVCPFFAPTAMFGAELQNGFDIVIGNPPYVFARDSASKGITVADKKYYVANYKLAQYQVNLYALFIEKSVNLLKDGGVLSFITPNNWLTINTNTALREMVLKQSRISIVNFLKQVFESADVDAAVMVFCKGRQSADADVRLYEWTDGLHEITSAKASFFQKINDSVINIEALKGNDTHTIMAKMEAASNQLKTIGSVKCGLGAYGRGDGIPPQTADMISNRVYHARSKVGPDFYKYLEGSDVSRYHLGWSGEYLKHGKHLREPRNDWNLFSTPRILVRQIPNKPPYCIHACFTKEVLLNDRNSMNIINIKGEPLYVLGVLNSKPTSWWFIHKFGKMQRGTFPQFKVNELATFPIPNATPAEQAAIASRVEAILAAKSADAGANVAALEREIDELVAGLYQLDEAEKLLVGIGATPAMAQST